VDVAELAAKLEELEARVGEVEEERDEYRRLYGEMLEMNRKLELGILGQAGNERFTGSDDQLLLGILGTILTNRNEDRSETKEVRGHQRHKPTGRKPLPEDLPRVEIEILPEEVEAEGRDAFEEIGAEVRETIERRPSSIVVVRVRRPKFVRKDRDKAAETKVLLGEPAELPIDRGLAGPGFLADTVVKRWQDHLPLHRLERIYKREGLDLARSTMCEWHGRLAELGRSLIEAMWKDGFDSPYICVDATGVLVQAKERCKRGHFWVAVAPGKHVLYGYSSRHDSAAVDVLLGEYKGYVVADAHAVYDHLYEGGERIEVGCWAHTRRYFFKALTSQPEPAREALSLFKALFRLEREFAGLSAKKRKRARKEHTEPIVDQFFAWCERHASTALDDTPLKKGIQYALNQREALRRFLDDGRLPLHNNISELHLRRQAIGRKNWLFVGNDDAASVNTTFVSLLASCEMHGIEPFAYLRDLLILLPGWPRLRVLELAPAYWRATLEREDVQRKLAANPFRRISASEPQAASA
jgi:transposase